ncbi:MAG: hypothetical protein HXX16_17185 [Bacteroidales bacterium]|nr:hypothetical protein [Bacteroidales bacterium]
MQTLTITLTFGNYLVVLIIAAAITFTGTCIYELFIKRMLSKRAKHFTAENNPFDFIASSKLIISNVSDAARSLKEVVISNSKIESSIEELKACQYELLEQIINEKKAATPKKSESNALTLTDYEAFGIYCFVWFDGFDWRVRCQLVTSTPTSKKINLVDLPGEFDSRSEAEENALILAESIHVSPIQEPIIESVESTNIVS